MKCCRSGCQREGTHHLVAKVWALGYPKSSTPITATIGIMLCRDHARDEAREKSVIGDEFWEVLNAMTAAYGRMPVDRASLEVVPVRGQVDRAQIMRNGGADGHLH